MPDLPVIDDPWIGQVLDDRFDVLALVGKGGMGAIYRCREQTTGVEMAVKLILDDWESEEEVHARFEREITASIGVRHPNVVQVLGHGQTDQGHRYYAMELIDGVSLLEHMENEGPLSSEAIAHIGAQVARGLQAAHDAGVIHRDLKPENILVDQRMVARVLDFGLALLQRGQTTAPDRLTQMDMRIGSPLYMSPEYCADGTLDNRSDLYALGAILYEAATGRTVFEGSGHDVIAHHVNTPITPVEQRRPGRHPLWLRRAIEALLEKDPDKRVQTADEAAAMLTRPPDVGDLRSLTPAPARGTPAIAPAAKLPSRPRSTTLRAVLPLLLLVSAAVWHAMMVGVSVGDEKVRPTTRVLAHQMAWHVTQAGGSAYDQPALNRMGRAHKVGTVINKPYAPPPWMAAMAWTAALDHEAAWGTFLGLQEALLLATLLLCWRWWQPLGLAPPMALAVAAAGMGGTAMALDLGWPVLVTLFLWVAALHRQDHWDGGLWLGLALCVSPRSLLLAPLWLFRGRLTELAIAGATLAVGSLMALAVLGAPTTAAYWTEVLPGMLLGDFSGLGQRVDVFANHAPAHLAATWVPGPSGQTLATAALAISWALGFAGFGVLGLLYRHSDDPWHRASTDALWLLAALLLPIFGTEHQLPWALPGIALAIAALWRGRLPAGWTLILGVSVAVLLYPITPLRGLYQSILLPDAPWLAPLVREMKLGALLVLAGALIHITRSDASLE